MRRSQGSSSLEELGKGSVMKKLPLAAVGLIAAVALTACQPVVQQPPLRPPQVGASTAPARRAAPMPASAYARVHGDVHSLDSAAPASGTGSCSVEYTDAAKGAGTATFVAEVRDGAGNPFFPAASDPYRVVLQLTVRERGDRSSLVSEDLGNGATTSDGSGWLDAEQGGADVDTNAFWGLVRVTVPVPLSRVLAVWGLLAVTRTDRSSYKRSVECSVAPSSRQLG